MSVEPEDEFQKELIEVFAQEAQEWIQQIHAALDELQQGPASDRRTKLIQSINAGITSLVGSAATIGLSDVEEASLSALPFVEAIRNQAGAVSNDDCAALCKQIGLIHAALTRSAGMAFHGEAAPDLAGMPSDSTPVSAVLEILRRLQDSRPASGLGSRDILHTVVAQVEGLKKKGLERSNVISLKEFLARWSEGEEGFLDGVLKQVPAIADVLRSLKSEGGETRGIAERLQGGIDHAAELCSAAQQVGASQAAEFFTGLHRFLTIIMQRRIQVAAHKYDAVESRLLETMRAVQTWVETGRMERAAISGILGQ